MADPTPEQLFAEADGLLRNKPANNILLNVNTESLMWLGRVAALVKLCRPVEHASFQAAIANVQSRLGPMVAIGYRDIMIAINALHSELRLRSSGPLNVAVGEKQVFQYFDELRKLIEAASVELLFVDPYLDAEFVSRYLLFVKPGTRIRLLTAAPTATRPQSPRLSQLLAAVDLFMKESGLVVAVRTSQGLHDRWLFINESQCYQSGASFKDGAKKSSTTITQITDVFPTVWDAYKALWDAGGIHR